MSSLAVSRAEGAPIPQVPTIKSRSDFLAVRGGARASCAAFLIEGRKRTLASAASPKAPRAEQTRFGFTITKKIGNAVVRNRIRRRLKSAVAALKPGEIEQGFDYVIVARSAAFDRPYSTLMSDLSRTLEKLHGRRPDERKKSLP